MGKLGERHGDERPERPRVSLGIRSTGRVGSNRGRRPGADGSSGSPVWVADLGRGLRRDKRLAQIRRFLGAWLGPGEMVLVVGRCRVGIDERRQRRLKPARSGIDHFAVTNSRLLLLRLRRRELLSVREFALDEVTYTRSGTHKAGEGGTAGELVFKAYGSSFRLVVVNSGISRLAAAAAVLRHRRPLNDGSGMPIRVVRIGDVGGSIWMDLIERDRQAGGVLRDWLGAREPLVAYVAGDINYAPAEHLDDSAPNAMAVTSSHLLILTSGDGELILLDAIPIRDVTVVEHTKQKRRESCLLKIRDRTLRAQINSAYADRLAVAVSRLPQGASVSVAHLAARTAVPARTLRFNDGERRDLAPYARRVRKGGYALLLTGIAAIWFGLPETGVPPQVWAIKAGGALVAIGVALILATRRRVRRAVKRALGSPGDESGLG
jgi:hypothetical protein